MDSGITLVSIPFTIIWPGDLFTISWLPTDVDPVLRYGSNPGGEIPANYPNFIDIQPTAPGVWDFDPVIFPPGLHYALLTSANDSLTSVEFWIVRENTNAVNMIWPFSDVNSSGGITTATPEFSWSPRMGVPYYHLILSDQAFEIETDPNTGELSTTGANIIWQVITSGTSIDYGTPDPSDNFTEFPPPLIGDLTGLNRPTYNWVVLNNYGNVPELTSDVVGELMGFEVALPPPFDSPVLLEPANQSFLSGDNLLFEWTAITEASNYHLYLSREEITADSNSTVFTPVWYVQSTVNATECAASNLLTSGVHRWKVIAENNQGLGTMSYPADFTYSVNSAVGQFYVRSSSNTPIQGVTIDFIPVEGPTLTPTLTDNGGYAERLMPYGTYILELSKVGFVTTQTSQLVIESSQTINNTYHLLEASSSAQGTVVDNQGQPVNFADITATNMSTGDEEYTSSNNNGYWSLDLVPDSWRFQASKDGYTSSPARTVTLQPESVTNLDQFGGPLTMTVNLYELDGYVLNTDGEPISLATVTCTKGVEEYQYTTSDNGFYTIDVGPGTWTLSASKPAFWLSSTLPPITIINSGSTNNIELTPSANIVSGVVFKGSVLANQDAVVRAIPAAGQIEEVTVNGQGNFILSLSTGEYQLNAYLTGYTSPTPINLSLGVGETISGINIVLTPNPSYITGKITSDGIQPVDSALVTSGAVTTLSNTQGNYTLNVAAGPRTVTASKTGYVSATSAQVNVSTGQTLANINLTITPNASTINGTVRSNGQAVYQANVTARKVSTGTITTVQTQQNGTYSFGLSFGTYWVKAAKTGLIAAAPESLQVTINPGQTVNGKDFNLIQNIGYISGSTVCNNQAVSYATVNLVALDNPAIVFNTQSGYYGTFNISATPQHLYKISVSKAGYVTAVDTSLNVTPNSTQEFTFNLTQLQSQLKGKVYALPDSTVIYGATVTAVKTTGGTYTAQTNTVGSYTLGLNAGTYQVTAAKAGYISVSRDTTLTPGQIIQGFKFYLQPNFAGLQGFVRRSSNQNAVPNALVSVTEVNTQTGASTYTDGTGYYGFDQLFQGSYNIEITHPEYQDGQVNGVVLLGGSTANQNVSLVALTGSIAGTVINSYGNPVSSVSVTMERASGGVYTVTTGSNGTYIKSNLPSGTYSISAAKSGYTTDDTTGVVLTPAQQLTGINFQILRNDGIIVGKVVSTEGANLGSVQVSASDGQGNFGNATTSSNGYYNIEDLFVNAQYTVTVSKSGYSNPSGPVIIQPSTPDSANFVMLPNNLTISGTVVNQNQTPKNNIPVQAVEGSVTLTNNTNSSGQFTINEAAPFTDYLVKTNSYNSSLNNTQIDTAVGMTSLTGLTLVIQEHSSSLSGLVTKSNGDPFTNIQVKARRIGGNLFTTNTGISGQWSIANLFAGDWKIYTSKLGYTVSPDTIYATLGLNQSLVGNDFVMTEIFIDISGTVRDDAGQAMNNVPVLAWSTVGTDTAYTNASGAYSFTGKTPNIAYEISTILPSADYDNDSQNILAGYVNITGIDLDVVVHNASVAGQVQASGGTGLSGVTINLTGQAPLTYDETIVTTSPAFNFNYLHSGTYDISFEKAGYLPYETSFTLNQSQVNNLGNITLQSVVNGVYGTVTNLHTASPMKNVVVKIQNVFVPADVHYDTTGSSGSYQVDNLTTNEYYNVTTYKKGFPDQTSNNFQLTASYQKNMNLTPYLNSIYGAVKNSAGIMQAGAVVEANKFGESVHYDTTNFFGDYSFTPLTSGNYQLHADQAPLDSYFENVSLAANGYSKYDLTVLNTAKLYGTVTYNGQNPPGAATVTLQNTVNQNIFTQQTGVTSASFFFTGMRANLYTISASISGFEVQNSPQTFTPVLGEVDTVHFYLSATQNALSGFVKDSTDLDVIGSATVMLHRTGELDTLDRITNAGGSFTFDNLTDGEYELWTYKSGYDETALSSVVIDIGNNQPVEQILWLRSIPGSISGTAKSAATGLGLNGTVIQLTQTGGEYDSVFVTGSTGQFLFAELEPGNYTLSASKPAYTPQPVSYNMDLALNQFIGGKDFLLTADIVYYDVEGHVSHGVDQLEDAMLILTSLNTGEKDTVYSDASGYYLFDDWQAPDRIQIRCILPGYPVLVSDAYDLDTGNLNIDFEYPSGKLQFHVTSDGVEPLENIQISILNFAEGVDTTLVTDAQGFAETIGLLRGDNLLPVPYNISVTHYLPGILKLQTYTDFLLHNETLVDDIILGISYEGPDTTQIQTADSIWAEVANDLVNDPAGFDISLFYKSVSASVFIELPMSPLPVVSAVITEPEPQTAPVIETSGRNKNNLNPEPVELNDDPLPPISLSAGDPGLQGGGTDAGFTTYYATVPAQTASGTVEFYIEAVAGNRVYSNSAQKDNYYITSAGVLAIMQMNPSAGEIQYALSQVINLQTFDDALNPLNDSLSFANVTWSHWDAEDTSSTLGTLTVNYSPTITDSAALSATFYAADTGTAKIKVKVTKDNITMTQIATFDLVFKQLASLQITDNLSGDKAIANTDSVTFTILASDINGSPMSIIPTWSMTPPGLGVLTKTAQNKAKFKPFPNIVGQLFVTVTDSISGDSATYNTANPNVDERGLFIKQYIGATTSVTLVDSSGFQLIIPAGSVNAGDNGFITLKRPPLPQVKKNSPGFEIHMDSYSLSSTVPFSSLVTQDSTLILTLPVPAETKRLNTVIGRWNDTGLKWESFGGDLSAGGSVITANINGFSEYVVMGESKPLGIEDLEFHPNPFSPKTDKKLQIEFILNSKFDASPQVTIKIYNMRGDLVRTVLDRASMPKGPHAYGPGMNVFQQGAGAGSVEWNGLTNSGLMARNGRYLVHIKVEDPSGSKDEMETVVLIK